MSEGRISPLFTWRTAITESALPPVARHVALTLSMYMSEKGDSAYPSHATLADDTGLAKSTVTKALRTIERAGYLVVARAPGRPGGRTRVNHYRAAVPKTTVLEVTVDTSGETLTSDVALPTVPPMTDSETVIGSAGNGSPDFKERSDRTTRERTTTTPETTPSAPRTRDPIWDGFVAWLGRSPETKSERGQWNKACGELRAIGVDSTLEVERRGRAYQRAYNGIVPTPLGLVAHWSEFGPPLGESIAAGPRDGHAFEFSTADPDSVCKLCGEASYRHPEAVSA